MTQADPSAPPTLAPRRKLRVLTTLKRWMPRAAFESVLIVFSVILALTVADWAERRRTAAEVAEVRAFFVEEIRANRAILVSDDILPHHMRLQSAFNAVTEDDPTQEQAKGAYRQIFRSGLHVAPLRDAVWRSAETGDLLAEMPIEDLFLLADVYKAQTTLDSLSHGFIGSIPDVVSSLESGQGLRAAVAMGQLHLADLVASEQRLIVLYDRALAALDKDTANRTDDAGTSSR